MLKKNTALEWLALCLVQCVIGVCLTLTDRVFAELMMVIITGNVIQIITSFFVKIPRTIPALLWTWSNKEVTCWLCLFLYHNWVWQKFITIKWFRAVWHCPSCCHRNHTIQCMWKSWTPAPSHAGKAYDWFQCCNCLGFSETVSDHPDVRTRQSTIFRCLITFYYNCGDYPLFLSAGSFFILPHF